MPMETITDEFLARHGFAWRASEEFENVRSLVCLPLEREGFTNAFSTRTGGVSSMSGGADLNLAGFNEDARENIYENRRRFLSTLPNGARGWSFASCWQIHSANVHSIKDKLNATDGEERCDALITKLPRLLLAVKTADCVPILLCDANTGACAAIHAGWRGTLESIIVRAVERLREEFNTNPQNIRAALGAAALSCCYEVGAEVVDAFKSKSKDAETLFTPTQSNHAKIDLHEANRRQLLSVGVMPERIYALPLCTMCHADLFFSYRREKQTHGKTGRLLGVIGRD